MIESTGSMTCRLLSKQMMTVIVGFRFLPCSVNDHPSNGTKSHEESNLRYKETLEKRNFPIPPASSRTHQCLSLPFLFYPLAKLDHQIHSRSLGSAPHRGTSIHNAQLAKPHCRITGCVKILLTRCFANHWEVRNIARYQSTLLQCAACKNALQKHKRCGLSNHFFYSQSPGRTPHRKATVDTIPVCSLQKRIAETQRVRTFNHKIYSQSLGSTPHQDASIHTVPMCNLQNPIAEAHRVREIYSQDVFPITGEHAPSQGDPYCP